MIATEDGQDWGDEDFWRSPWIEDDLEPGWRYPLETSAVSIDWVTEGGEWLPFLGEAIGHPGSFGWRSTIRGGTKRNPGIVFSPNHEKTCIWCCPVEGRLRIEVWGLNEPDKSMVDRWQRAIESATDNFRASPNEAWIAAIESNSPHGGLQKLSTEGTVAQMKLTPTQDPIFGRKRSKHSFDGYDVSVSFPIVVHGSARATHSLTNVRALIELRSLCAMLTVAWGTHWTLASRPVPVESWRGLPTHSRWHDPGSGIKFADSNVFAENVMVEDWMTNAMGRLKVTTALRQALLMYDEAVSVSWEHPSLSLVSIVSALETLAEVRSGPLSRCPSCRQYTGSTRRFEKLLLEVTSQHEAKTLADAYGSRSETVHAAALHERERAFGHFLDDQHLAKNSGHFWALRLKLDRLCRTLLLRELGAVGELRNP